jgi:hypothetical protein
VDADELLLHTIQSIPEVLELSFSSGVPIVNVSTFRVHTLVNGLELRVDSDRAWLHLGHESGGQFGQLGDRLLHTPKRSSILTGIVERVLKHRESLCAAAVTSPN